jgi:hypothetical protein
MILLFAPFGSWQNRGFATEFPTGTEKVAGWPLRIQKVREIEMHMGEMLRRGRRHCRAILSKDLVHRWNHIILFGYQI